MTQYAQKIQIEKKPKLKGQKDIADEMRSKYLDFFYSWFIKWTKVQNILFLEQAGQKGKG